MSHLTRLVVSCCKGATPEMTSSLLIGFGKALIRSSPEHKVTKQNLINVLNNCWTIVMKINDLNRYLR